jgi:hypothetical protein
MCVYVCARVYECMYACMCVCVCEIIFISQSQKRPSNYYPTIFDLYLYYTMFYFSASKIICVWLLSLKWE